MRVELVRTLKTDRIWKKGRVFDDTLSPIPGDIRIEVNQKARTVRVLPDLQPAPDVMPEVEESEGIPEVEIAFEEITPETIALAHGMSENFQIAPEDDETPEVATEENVAAETDNENLITQETPTTHLPELEGLIQMKGTIAAVAALIGVTYGSINRYRKGAIPNPDTLNKIKKEYKKLMRQGNDQDRIDNTAAAGVEGAHVEP